MSNQLGVAVKNSIISLKDRGYSNREIARMLGICRDTVNKHVKNHYTTETQPNPPAGSSVQNQPKAPPVFPD
jgi:IS30 family transposase